MSDIAEDPAENAEYDPENIKALKEEEMQKLSAAEKDYEGRQRARRTAVAPDTPVQEEPAEPEPQPDARRGRDKDIPWVPGLILIGLGVFFLINNITGFTLHNWWALFILIPAFGSFSSGVRELRAEGEFTREVWGAFFGGFVMSMIAAAFLFNLNWGLIWPVFLVLGGVGIFLTAWRSD